MAQGGRVFYLFEVAVSGSGLFPYDMLRYDQCAPRQQSDTAGLDPHNIEHRTVTLRHWSMDTKASGLTPERWKWYGWTIMTIDKAF